jgi:dynein heavy chain
VPAPNAARQAQCRELLGGGGAAKGAAAGGDCGGLAADALSDSLALYRRCAQLRHLFATAHRFAELGRLGHVPGLPAAATAFADTVEALRRQPADLLDPGAAPDLDRDMLDFEVHLNDLELQVTRALRASFDAAASTRHALSLLRQYAPLLPAAAAAAEVDAMFAAAFARFGGDLEAVQRQYERHKGDPPMARGAPPVAGAVLWARGLLRRIEAPMQQ